MPEYSSGRSCSVNRVEVAAETVVNPTEDPAKVEKALRAILKEGSIERLSLGRESFLLRVKAYGLDSLVPLQGLLRQDRIRDAARSILFSSIAGKTIRFHLNKQVACVNHVSFSQPSGESPLGPISVEISCDDPESLIDWIAPRSR